MIQHNTYWQDASRLGFVMFPPQAWGILLSADAMPLPMVGTTGQWKIMAPMLLSPWRNRWLKGGWILSVAKTAQSVKGNVLELVLGYICNTYFKGVCSKLVNLDNLCVWQHWRSILRLDVMSQRHRCNIKYGTMMPFSGLHNDSVLWTASC